MDDGDEEGGGLDESLDGANMYRRFDMMEEEGEGGGGTPNLLNRGRGRNVEMPIIRARNAL